MYLFLSKFCKQPIFTADNKNTLAGGHLLCVTTPFLYITPILAKFIISRFFFKIRTKKMELITNHIEAEFV